MKGRFVGGIRQVERPHEDVETYMSQGPWRWQPTVYMVISCSSCRRHTQALPSHDMTKTQDHITLAQMMASRQRTPVTVLPHSPFKNQHVETPKEVSAKQARKFYLSNLRRPTIQQDKAPHDAIHAPFSGLHVSLF